MGSSRDCCGTPQHDAYPGETGECSDGAGTTFGVASRAAIAADPSKGTVDTSSLRQDFESGISGSLAAPSGHGQLAKDYHADRDRFPKAASLCEQCGLCVRYCALIKQKNAIGFVDRGPTREISFIPDIASEACWDCKDCFPLCPTSTLQDAFDLMRLSEPSQ